MLRKWKSFIWVEDIFYAIWKADSSFGSNTMQGWTGCSSLSTGSSKTLTDARDNNTYTVAKLADGRCWMTQNLRIGSNSRTTTLNSSNTNINTNYTLPIGEANFKKSGGENFSEEGLYISSNTNQGGYYTWYTATAGDTRTSGRATYSICPKNWYFLDEDEARSIISNYGSLGVNQSPIYFDHSGYYNGQTLTSTNRGNWWTSSISNNQQPYVIYHSNNRASIGTGSIRPNGYAVRCFQ